MNNVDVCNLALGYIGQGASEPIESLSNPQDEGSRACALVFRPALRSLLRSWRWPFAQASVALATVVTTVPGWAYAYTYPNACLRLHGLDGSNYDPMRSPDMLYRAPYKLLAHPSGAGQLIATDLSGAWAHYTKDMEGVVNADALFHEALAWSVGSRLGMVLKASPDIARYAREQARIAVMEAAATMQAEQLSDAEPLAETIRAQTGGSSMWDEAFR